MYSENSEVILDKNLKDIYFREGERRVIALQTQGGRICFTEPTNEVFEVRQYIAQNESLLGGKYFGKNLPTERISKLEMEKYFGNLDGNKSKDISDDDGEMSRRLKQLLFKGANDGCSDIHIEVYESRTVFYQRVDGDRYEINDVPDHDLGIRFASYIFFHKAIEKEEDFFEKRINNGKLEEFIQVDGVDRNTQWRVSWMPSNEGGKLALRWLNKQVHIGTLRELGWPEDYARVIDEFIQYGTGGCIIAGKMGSGKSTSLAAMMESIDPSFSRHSFEDPPEFRLKGVVQTQVRPNAKVSDESDEYQDQAYFANGTFRQDTDVELYGETRTKEGASQVARKSETGQIIFTSIHTSSAWGIPGTLIDHLHVSPSLVASSDFLKVLVYQALVKKLCGCSLPFDKWRGHKRVTEEEVRHAEFTLNALIEEGKLDNSVFESIRFKNPDGCNECKKSGEKGRLPLLEVIVVDDDDREYWFNKDFIGWKKHLFEKGYKDISFHGAQRVINGEVDLFTTEKRIGRFVKIQTQKVYEAMKHD
ncbi:GspE/PulE family protein [Vibrio ostreicida]|uniref:GspE/PulE family protein n=1 Tax=Vibrio ostreicida TaxID=526588 RepID=UPI003B5AA05C